MNLLIKIGIFILVDYFLFKTFGFLFGMIGVGITVARILYILGFFRKPSIFRGAICDGIAFLKDYQGPIYKNGAAFEEALKIIKTFKLDQVKEGEEKYCVIGVYYDKPGEVEESKLRYSIGIYQKNKGFPSKPPEELQRYCESNNYNYTEIPNTTALYSHWQYSTYFTMMNGIKKFNVELKKCLNDASFRKTYRLKPETKCNIILELYETDSNIAFYTPILNEEKFRFYKKDK
jgi:hypothetical protein